MKLIITIIRKASFVLRGADHNAHNKANTSNLILLNGHSSPSVAVAASEDRDGAGPIHGIRGTISHHSTGTPPPAGDGQMIRKELLEGRQPFIHHWTTNNGGHNNHQRFLGIQVDENLLILLAQVEFPPVLSGIMWNGPDNDVYFLHQSNAINYTSIWIGGWGGHHYTKTNIILPGKTTIQRR